MTKEIENQTRLKFIVLTWISCWPTTYIQLYTITCINNNWMRFLLYPEKSRSRQVYSTEAGGGGSLHLPRRWLFQTSQKPNSIIVLLYIVYGKYIKTTVWNASRFCLCSRSLAEGVLRMHTARGIISTYNWIADYTYYTCNHACPQNHVNSQNKQGALGQSECWQWVQCMIINASCTSNTLAPCFFGTWLFPNQWQNVQVGRYNKFMIASQMFTDVCFQVFVNTIM